MEKEELTGINNRTYIVKTNPETPPHLPLNSSL